MLCLAIFEGCIILLVFALYLQYMEGIEPCPLCSLQRFFYIVIAILSLIYALHNPSNFFAPLYASLIGFTALIGMLVAGRQVWLQHLPTDQVPECGPGLEYLLDTLSMFEVLSVVLSGSGECAQVDWEWLGLSIAEYSALLFFACFICSVILFVWHRKSVAS